MKHVMKGLTLLIIIGLAGCASNSELEAVRATANTALQTANEAKAEARSATEAAQTAQATADSAENKIESMAKKQTGKHK